MPKSYRGLSKKSSRKVALGVLSEKPIKVPHFFFLVFCKAQGEDTDADALNIFEGIGTGDEGGTSSADVIDEQYVLAL